MWNTKRTQVLIAGAGPVGITAALCFFKKGIDFEIVDKASGPSDHSKACLLSPATLEFLNGLGLFEEILEKGLRIRNVQLFEGDARLANLGLSDLPSRFPFILSVPQCDLERILLERLKQCHKNVLWNHRISSVNQNAKEISVEADLLGEHMTGYAVMHEEKYVKKTVTFIPKVIVAADGFYSLIRRLQKIEYEPVAETASSLVFETKRNPREDPVLKLGFTSEGTSSYVTLPHGFGRYGFTTGYIKDVSSDRDTGHEIYSENIVKFPELTDSNLEELLRKRMPYQAQNIKEIVWRASVPFGAHLADRIWSNHIFLLGDAARSGFPSGAKSLNYALPEAGEMTDAMTDYLATGNDSFLKELDATVRRKWLALSYLGHLPPDPKDTDQPLNKDLGKILQALPFTGKDLEFISRKMSKLMPRVLSK